MRSWIVAVPGSGTASALGFWHSCDFSCRKLHNNLSLVDRWPRILRTQPPLQPMGTKIALCSTSNFARR